MKITLQYRLEPCAHVADFYAHHHRLYFLDGHFNVANLILPKFMVAANASGAIAADYQIYD